VSGKAHWLFYWRSTDRQEHAKEVYLERAVMLEMRCRQKHHSKALSQPQVQRLGQRGSCQGNSPCQFWGDAVFSDAALLCTCFIYRSHNSFKISHLHHTASLLERPTTSQTSLRTTIPSTAIPTTSHRTLALLILPRKIRIRHVSTRSQQSSLPPQQLQ
jgi:hypothetical protein